jgi:hypothetical protein
MSISPNFNLESLNLDIESYSNEELIQILRLPANYNESIISKNKNSLQDKINKLSIDSSKKYSYLLFLDNAEKKLLNKFLNDNNGPYKQLTNCELPVNTLTNYDSNFIIENKSITHDPLKNITVGQYNDNVRVTSISINSIFRPNYYNAPSSNFTITLPETINNVISMRVSSLNIPIHSIYNISKELGNSTLIIGGKQHEISGGFYSFIQDSSNSIINALNIAASSDASFSIDPISRKLQITTQQETSLNFVNNSQPLTLTLGWFLGFRAAEYKGTTHTAEAPIPYNITDTNHYSREFFLAINDYQTGSINKFTSAFAESLLPENIITKFDYNYNSHLSYTMEEQVDRTRYYDGPSQINRLTFTIYDQYGRIVNLNHNDWNCVLTFEHYRAVQN